MKILKPEICYNMNKIKPCACLIVCKYPPPTPIHNYVPMFKSVNTRNIENSSPIYKDSRSRFT